MRPIERPYAPYTLQNIVDHVFQHFVVENNPRCVNDREQCVYGLTGCGVGCLLTQKDGDILDIMSTGQMLGAGWMRGFKENSPLVYQLYFGDSPSILSALETLQSAHDGCVGNITIAIQSCLDRICKDYNLVMPASTH